MGPSSRWPARWLAVQLVVVASASSVHAQGDPPAPAPADPPVSVAAESAPPAGVHIHGFASEGGIVSTSNNYIGHSSRGSLELFEAGINFSTELTDKLRVGMQLFSQDEGTANDPTPRLDWAYLDYRFAPWLGLRAGRAKIPFGLYNDYIDIDSARLPILLPQSIYPVSNRAILTAQTGFLAYGDLALCEACELDYQIYGGVLSASIPGAQDANATRLYALDDKYVVGGDVFWHPVDGLRVGVSGLRVSLDEYVNVSPQFKAVLIATGLAPATFDGNLIISLRPASLWIASTEYVHGDWSFAAEYSHWYARTPVTPPVLPTTTTDSERYYAMASYRISERLEVGAYYAVVNADVHDRDGTNKAKFAQPFDAWKRDATATVRYDVNEHWLWKLEAHALDGAADLDPTLNAMPQRYWKMVLARTTVTF